MSLPPVKIKALPPDTIKFKSSTYLAGRLAAGDGIAIVEAGGVSTISADTAGSSLVTGPASSTDNAIARFNGTDGTVIQNSVVTVSDAGVISGAIWSGALVGIISVLAYGADPTGATSSSAAFAAAYAAGDEILVPDGTYKLSTNQTWPITKTWHIIGMLSIDSGVTITNNGVVESGFNQIFSGFGTIVGMRFNRPEWWGATNGGTAGGHDDLAAMNAAVASAQRSYDSSGDRPTVRLTGGSGYLVSGPVVLSPNVSVALDFGGNGLGVAGTTRIIAKSTFTGSHILKIDGQSDLLSAIMNFYVHDFSVSAESVLNIQGIRLGSAGKNIGGLGRSRIENVEVDSVAVGLGWGDACSVRLIDFRHFNIWLPNFSGATGMLFDAPGDASALLGDMAFHGCQIVAGGANQTGVFVRMAAGVGGGLTGIDFYGLTVYGCASAIKGLGSDNQIAGDFTFYGLRIDGGLVTGVDGVVLTATGGNASRPQFYDWRFTDSWINHCTGKSFCATGDVAGTLRIINCVGGMITNGGLLPVEYKNVIGGTWPGLLLRGCAASLTELVKLHGGTEHVSITGLSVVEGGVPLPTYVATIANTADNNTINSAAAEGQYGTAFANVTSSGTNNQAINLPGTVSSTGTGAIVRAVAPTISGNLSLTGQFNQNVSVHANAVQALGENAVNYGFFGAADNIITGGVANYLGIYGANGIEFGAVTNISRMKIITGVQVGVPTSGDKGLGTINLAGGAYVNNVAIPTISSADALSNKTSYNKVAITAPATSATLTILNGKTLTANNTLTLSGTDGSTLNMGAGGALGTAAFANTGTSGHVVGYLDANNTYSGVMLFTTTFTCSAQIVQDVTSHGNAIVTLRDNAVSYGNLGAADNIVTGGSTTDFGLYANNSFNFGAGASNTSRVKITLGLFTSGATGGDKGANTINATAYYIAGAITGLTKVITFTRDMTAATGSVSYTGAGFKPTSLNATGGVGGIADYVLSSGFCDSSLTQGNSGIVSGGGQVTSTAFIRAIDSTFGKVQSFTVTSMDSDGFTGTWTKTGLPTGTATYYVLCRC